MKLIKIGALLVVFVLGVAAVACSDDDDNGGDGGETAAPTDVGTPEATEPADETEAPDETEPPENGEGDASTVRVNAGDNFFNALSDTVPAGEQVTFEFQNVGQAPHTLTFYRDAEYTDALEGADTGSIGAGETDQLLVTFNEAGTFFYRCEIHPNQMQGEITAQ